MPEFIESLVVDFWATMAEMSPFLLFGFFVAGVLSVLVSPALVEKHLGGSGLWPLIKASIFGVPRPITFAQIVSFSSAFPASDSNTAFTG